MWYPVLFLLIMIVGMIAVGWPRLLWAAESDLIARGRYVFALAGGCGCHTAKGESVNAGGRPLKTPYGTFYGTNITPDPTYGIGQWTDRQIGDSIRLGVRPDGSIVSPVMPYPAFSGMSDEDVTALVAYLRSVPAVTRANQPHEISLPFSGVAMRVWRWLFFEPIAAPARAPTEGIERGRYISGHVAHCQECHTPRTRIGTLDLSLHLAGNPAGIDDEVTPNITPEVKTGIGEWSEDEIVSLLQTGFLPNFDNVQGLMALVIEGIPEGGYKDMTKDDALAVARYLKSVPPIEHRVGKE